MVTFSPPAATLAGGLLGNQRLPSQLLMLGLLGNQRPTPLLIKDLLGNQRSLLAKGCPRLAFPPCRTPGTRLL